MNLRKYIPLLGVLGLSLTDVHNKEGDISQFFKSPKYYFTYNTPSLEVIVEKELEKEFGRPNGWFAQKVGEGCPRTVLVTDYLCGSDEDEDYFRIFDILNKNRVNILFLESAVADIEVPLQSVASLYNKFYDKKLIRIKDRLEKSALLEHLNKSSWNLKGIERPVLCVSQSLIQEALSWAENYRDMLASNSSSDDDKATSFSFYRLIERDILVPVLPQLAREDLNDVGKFKEFMYKLNLAQEDVREERSIFAAAFLIDYLDKDKGRLCNLPAVLYRRENIDLISECLNVYNIPHIIITHPAIEASYEKLNTEREKLKVGE